MMATLDRADVSNSLADKQSVFRASRWPSLHAAHCCPRGFISVVLRITPMRAR